MRFYYGPSRGDTGMYGIGDIVKGTRWKKVGDQLFIDDEPVYNVFIVTSREELHFIA